MACPVLIVFSVFPSSLLSSDILTAICHHGRGKTDDLERMLFVESFKRATGCDSDDGDMCTGAEFPCINDNRKLPPCPIVIDSAVSLGYSRSREAEAEAEAGRAHEDSTGKEYERTTDYGARTAAHIAAPAARTWNAAQQL
ncbi:hypothetical protein M440DRAFT_1391491 [Trichoderma longibrachiatum ATCC 18648]|uniref:Secreted protein n=1 Tax=Trichoderma longibrachiatum ATCC 18648 TaxID=983965 RepID=A0A2T4C601_TRILO|nr:hypothetical protein M440DRAFT_1391491 [Trichoderma longibrachiatum ATCC 18648]